MIADFFVVADTDAARDDGLGDLPEVDLAEYRRVTPLELSMLWAILRGCDWNVEMMDGFMCVLEKDGG